MWMKDAADRLWAQVAYEPESDGNQGFERLTSFGSAALGCGVVPGWEGDADLDHNNEHDAQASVFLLRWATAMLGFEHQEDFETTFARLIDTLSEARQQAEKGELNEPPDPTTTGKVSGKGPVEATSKNPEPIEQEPPDTDTKEYQPE